MKSRTHHGAGLWERIVAFWERIVAFCGKVEYAVAWFGLVVGCLCTPLDRLSDSAMLPRADVGDLVAIFCAGAYGASASPANFLGQGPAREMLI